MTNYDKKDQVLKYYPDAFCYKDGTDMFVVSCSAGILGEAKTEDYAWIEAEAYCDYIFHLEDYLMPDW